MANQRVARGGGSARQLSSGEILAQRGGIGVDWFGPGAPLPAMAPGSERSWDYPSNFNAYTTRRQGETVSFETLAALADAYSIIRIIIETRKDQMAALKLNVIPKGEDKVTGPTEARCDEAEAFLAEPYPGLEWDDWLRRVLEDLFVYDAPAIYPRPNLGGGVYGFLPFDGGTIKRVIDHWGNTPEPPAAAYVQVIKGVGATLYTRDQLIYRPRNQRNRKPYGFGPVEQILAIVNIALRRETWQINFFTEGNMPDALIGVPTDWTPAQIRDFQDSFDARLAGTEKRRGATFVPGEVAKGYVPTKDTEMFGAAEQWLARVVCFAFSVSPQPFVTQVNRATAETAKATGEEEGLEPLKKWLKRTLDRMLAMRGCADLEVRYVTDTDIDPKVQADIAAIYVNGGIMTRNEARVDMGRDPDPAPEADELAVTTAGGVVPLAIKSQIAQSKAKMEAMPPPALPAPGAEAGAGGPAQVGGPGPKKPPSAAGADGGDRKGGGAAGAGAGKAATPAASSGGGRAGKSHRFFTQANGPLEKFNENHDEHGRFGAGGGAHFGPARKYLRGLIAKVGSEDDSEDPADDLSSDPVDDPLPGDEGYTPPDPLDDAEALALDRPLAESATEQLLKAVIDLFNLSGEKVAADALKHLTDLAFQAGGQQQQNPNTQVTANLADTLSDLISSQFDLSEMIETIPHLMLQRGMEDLTVDSALKALAQIGPYTTDALVNQLHDDALQYLKERGAELVGKRVLADGTIIDNPNAEWSITESTREAIKNLMADGLENGLGAPQIAESIRDSFAFSEERATMIARTEVSFANSEGKWRGWQAGAEASGKEYLKFWQVSLDENVCPICEGNEAQGGIPLDDEFDSGDLMEPAHPRCQCVTYIGEATGAGGEQAAGDGGGGSDEDGE